MPSSLWSTHTMPIHIRSANHTDYRSEFPLPHCSQKPEICSPYYSHVHDVLRKLTTYLCTELPHCFAQHFCGRAVLPLAPVIYAAVSWLYHSQKPGLQFNLSERTTHKYEICCLRVCYPIHSVVSIDMIDNSNLDEWSTVWVTAFYMYHFSCWILWLISTGPNPHLMSC